MKPFEERPLERVRYWQGQMLRSQDFRGQLSDGAQHRWWHNRALHDVFGVHQGLAVSAVGSGSPLSKISVDEGLAYDCFGRELILDWRLIVQIPVDPTLPPHRANNLLVLLLRYMDEPDCGCRERTNESCWPSSGSSRGSAVNLAWKPACSVRPADGVPLALVDYTDPNGPVLKPGFVPRPARAMAKPLIGHGATLPQTTVWEPWLVLPPEGSRVIGLQTKIDTSAAGFTAVPNYSAWIAKESLPIVFPSIVNESSQGFTFRIFLLALERRGGTILNVLSDSGGRRMLSTVIRPLLPERLNISIEWLGCQMPPRVPYLSLAKRSSNALLQGELAGAI